MRPVEDWFLDWLAEHRVRFEGIKLPDPFADEHAYDPEEAEEARRAQILYEGWQQHFDREGVTEDDAHEASRRLQAKKSFPLDHFHDLLEIARALASGRNRGVVETPREAAKRASLGCPECSGQGIAVRFRHDSRPIGAPVYLHCVCPLGRHYRAEGLTFGGAECLDLARLPKLQGESGDRYRVPPRPKEPSKRPTEPAGKSEVARWWATKKPEANVPASP